MRLVFGKKFHSKTNGNTCISGKGMDYPRDYRSNYSKKRREWINNCHFRDIVNKGTAKIIEFLNENVICEYGVHTTMNEKLSAWASQRLWTGKRSHHTLYSFDCFSLTEHEYFTRVTTFLYSVDDLFIFCVQWLRIYIQILVILKSLYNINAIVTAKGKKYRYKPWSWFGIGESAKKDRRIDGVGGFIVFFFSSNLPFRIRYSIITSVVTVIVINMIPEFSEKYSNKYLLINRTANVGDNFLAAVTKIYWEDSSVSSHVP